MIHHKPWAIATTTLFALIILVGISTAHAAVKIRAANNGDIIVDISDKRGIASY